VKKNQQLKEKKMAELIIVFREVLEATLIVGILYTFLKQTNQNESITKLWQGVFVALAASVVGSFLFQQFAGGFKGQAGKLFEGIVMIVAAGVLGTVIVWMAKNKNIAEDLKGKAEQALSSNKVGLGIFLLAFVSVFREGIETILFLYGVMMKQGGLSISLSLLGAVMGIGMGYLIFVQGKKVPLKTFFNVSSILLIFVAAGMFAYGIHELESAGIIPDYGRIWDINPAKLADGSYPLMHDKGYVGSLLKGLFGYNGDPSLIELLAWFLSLSGLTYVWKKVS
jgi:high-affinity iron transporter